MQMQMCGIFCVLIVRKAMKCNILGCSHVTAIFHFRLNSHIHDYDFTDITDASQTHRVQCDHKTKIAIS